MNTQELQTKLHLYHLCVAYMFIQLQSLYHYLRKKYCIFWVILCGLFTRFQLAHTLCIHILIYDLRLLFKIHARDRFVKLDHVCFGYLATTSRFDISHKNVRYSFKMDLNLTQGNELKTKSIKLYMRQFLSTY